MSSDRIDVVFGAKIGELKAGLSEATAAVRASTEQMKGQFAGLSGAMSAVQGPLLAVTALLAGGAIFGRAIGEAAELGEHLQVLSQKTGIQADELSRLEYAAKLGDTGVENLDTSLIKLARTMDEARSGSGTAADAMKAIGVSATDAHGQLRPVRDVLLDVATKFQGMEDGAGKAALAMEIFGKGGTAMIPMLNQGAEGISKLEAEADRLGATMSNEGAQAAADYGDAMDRLHAMVDGMWRTIAVSVMPTLTALADAFTNTAGSGDILSGVVDVVVGTFRFLGTVVIGTKFILEEFYESCRLIFEGVATFIAGAGMAAVAAAQGRFGDAAAIIKDTFGDMAENVRNSSKRMEQDATNAADALARMYGFKDGPASAAPARGGGTTPPPPPHTPPPKKAPADERLATWREEFAKLAALDHAGKDTLLADEAVFWRQKLAMVQGGTKADEKLREQIGARIRELGKQLHADELESVRIRNETRRQGELDALDIEREGIEERRSLHQIEATDAEAQLIALNQRVLAIKLAALEEQRALVAGDMVAVARIDKQIEEAKRASGREITGITKETTKTVADDWESMFGHVTNVFSQSVTAIINGTQSLRGALRGIFQNITLDFLASKAKELQHHIAIELAKRGVTTGTALHKVATESWAALKSLAITAASAIKEIAIHAARAAAAAFAAIAGIPFVGPVLAPIAAGVALAAVLALGSRVASAKGGYDIPAGVNPLTQLHQEEMVLPAPLANAVRGMASGRSDALSRGSVGTAAPSGMTAATIASAIGAVVAKAAESAPREVHHHAEHVTVQAIDAQSFSSFLQRNTGALAGALRQANRNGHRMNTPV